MTPSKEQIIEKLKQVQDPELKRDVVSLGMVQNVQAENGKISVQLAVTTPLQAVKNQIESDARKILSALPGVSEVRIEVKTLAKTPFPVQQPSAHVRHYVAVASGKGGVGKTTAAVNLALALARRGNAVGLMDGDMYGPNVPLMLGVDPSRRPQVNSEEKLVPIEAQGIKMISMGVLVPPDQPMVWRGPMLHSAVTQFVQKVEWGTLDFLLIDLPPGTGDVQLSLVQTVPLSGAVIVTTPQEVALMDVRKGIAMFQKTGVPILGVLENMTGDIFGRGGGKKAAEAYGAPFLGEIPLDARVREGGDEGSPIVVSRPDSPAAQAFGKAAEQLAASLSQLTEA